MNRRQFERHLREHGCILHHHGAKHDIWLYAASLAQAPVPRHNWIKRGTVRGICRILGIPRPGGI
jgi:mRNA interferase HicA